MLFLLKLPIELLRTVFYALRGLVDVLRGHHRLRVEFTTLINAPRALVWRLSTGDRVVLDGPPMIEILTEPLPDSDGLFIERVSIGGQLRAQIVQRMLKSNEVEGKLLSRTVPHALSVPPEGGRDCLAGVTVAETPRGTALTMFNELTVRSFRDRIVYPIGVRRLTSLIKQQCEKEAGTSSRLAAFAKHPLPLWALALLLFSFFVGWQFALVLALVLTLHEAGRVAAMRMVGVEGRGTHLFPFGAAAVTKTSYRTQGRLGFIALMGPAVSLIPTLGLAAMYPVTGDITFLRVAWLFALVNLGNLLPIYPLDGGLVLSSLFGSVSPRFGAVASLIGILSGLGLALYLQSFRVSILFLVFAVQRYRYVGRNRTSELKPLSLAGGTGLALASIATFALYFFALEYTRTAPAAWAESRLTGLPAAANAWLRPAATDAGDFQFDGKHWTVRLEVASYENFTARISAYDAPSTDQFFEIAAINTHAP